MGLESQPYLPTYGTSGRAALTITSPCSAVAPLSEGWHWRRALPMVAVCRSTGRSCIDCPA